MPKKERIQDYLAFKVVNLFHDTFKARLMEKLPFYREALFCKDVYCYVASEIELRRSERLYLPDVHKWLKSFKPGEIFYDVGANIGMFSLTVAKIHNGDVKVYAFEPSFSTFGSLVHNVIGNNFGGIIIPFSIPLGREHGLGNFNYKKISSGTSFHTLNTLIGQTGEEFTPEFCQQVINYSLDDLVEQFNFPIPSHVKIDVDGGELNIIEGMQRVLKNAEMKSVLVEITKTSDDDKQVMRIMDIFLEAGYQNSLQITHSGFNKYPLVSDVLFTKNWELNQ